VNGAVSLPRVRRVTFGVLGVAATVFGLLLLVLPGVATLGPAAILLDAVASTPLQQVLLVAGGLVVAALVLGGRTGSDPEAGDQELERRLSQLPGTPPEQVTAGDDQVAAAALDEQIAEAIAEGGPAYRDAQQVLRTTAVSVYADAAGVSIEQAREAVARGQWTRDPVAAALLADDRGPALGRSRTLRLLALPRRERDERLRRTIAAIERLEGA
jgi:hypothetical protein